MAEGAEGMESAQGGAGSRVVVVVSYFRDGDEHPRGGPARRRDAVYWANIGVNAATLRHVAGPEPEFVVCAGEPPPAPADGVLDRAGARIREVPFAHRPPDDFYARYTGSLYMLDAMTALAGEVADDDVVLLVDPDIVWVRGLEPLVAEVRRGGVVAYDLGVPPDVPMCHLTREDQWRILSEMTGDGGGDGLPRHFGGELYGLLGSELRAVVAEIASLWEATMERYRRGLDHFNVEEHVMNAVLWRRGEQTDRAGEHVQRILTLPEPFGTRERAAADLVAWHLPLEKDRAFPRLLSHLARGRALPPPGPEYRRWLARRTGIEAAGVRVLTDRLRQAKWVLDGRRRRGSLHPGL